MTFGDRKTAPRQDPPDGPGTPRSRFPVTLPGRLLTLMLTLSLTVALSACGAPEDAGEGAEAPPPPPMAKLGAEECVVTPPEEPMACTMQFDPVCGCDGVTYGNACVAESEGVPRYEPGECPDSRQ